MTIPFLSACSDRPKKNDTNIPTQNEKKSRVLKFEYGGYGDTNKASIYGDIYEYDTTYNSKDSLHPLTNVSVKVEHNNLTTFTDTAGQFTLGFDKGTFNLVIEKEGYQPLSVTNYFSNPDQITHAIILLERGTDLQKYEIPKWTK
jgi:hypothetical protein